MSKSSRLVGLALGLGLGACNPPVAKLQVDTTEVRIYGEGGFAIGTLALDARDRPLASTAVQWHSSAPQVASVDERPVERRSDGALVYRIEGGESGVAWLTAKAGTATADIHVVVGIPRAVEVEPPAVRLSGPGQSQRLQVQVRDDRSQPIPGAPVWIRLLEGDARPGAPAVVTVASVADGGFEVTAQALGHASLMVLSGSKGPGDGGADPAGTLRTLVGIDVAPAPAPPPPALPPAPVLTVVPASASLRVGQTVALQLRLGGEIVRGKVKWKSLSPKVVSVNARGKAKARRRGRAEVLAIALHGKATARATLLIR